MKVTIFLLIVNVISMLYQLLTVAYGDFTMVTLTAVIANAVASILLAFSIGKYSGGKS